MPSVVARIGVGRLALLAVPLLAALLALTFLAGGKSSVRQQNRANHVLSLDTPAGPPASATASVGGVDSEIGLAHAESRSAVKHALARAPKTNAASVTTHVAAGAPSDAQIRRMLKHEGVGLSANRATLNPDGTAQAPFNAPDAVLRVIEGGNAIYNFPYIWGGGHGSFVDKGYDCSGSVSFALHGAHLISSPMDSSQFMSWARSGPGKWVTVYANSGHAFMMVAGLRFDTGYRDRYGADHGAKPGSGPRWGAKRPTSGFVARHPGI